MLSDDPILRRSSSVKKPPPPLVPRIQLDKVPQYGSYGSSTSRPAACTTEIPSARQQVTIFGCQTSRLAATPRLAQFDSQPLTREAELEIIDQLLSESRSSAGPGARNRESQIPAPTSGDTARGKPRATDAKPDIRRSPSCRGRGGTAGQIRHLSLDKKSYPSPVLPAKLPLRTGHEGIPASSSSRPSAALHSNNNGDLIVGRNVADSPRRITGDRSWYSPQGVNTKVDNFSDTFHTPIASLTARCHNSTEATRTTGLARVNSTRTSRFPHTNVCYAPNYPSAKATPQHSDQLSKRGNDGSDFRRLQRPEGCHENPIEVTRYSDSATPQVVPKLLSRRRLTPRRPHATAEHMAGNGAVSPSSTACLESFGVASFGVACVGAASIQCPKLPPGADNGPTPIRQRPEIEMVRKLPEFDSSPCSTSSRSIRPTDHCRVGVANTQATTRPIMAATNVPETNRGVLLRRSPPPLNMLPLRDRQERLRREEDPQNLKAKKPSPSSASTSYATVSKADEGGVLDPVRRAESCLFRTPSTVGKSTSPGKRSKSPAVLRKSQSAFVHGSADFQNRENIANTPKAETTRQPSHQDDAADLANRLQTALSLWSYSDDDDDDEREVREASGGAGPRFTLDDSVDNSHKSDSEQTHPESSAASSSPPSASEDDTSSQYSGVSVATGEPNRRASPSATTCTPRPQTARRPRDSELALRRNSLRSFKARRERLTIELFELYNRTVFGCRLPVDLQLVWNPRLTRTAGQTLMTKQRCGLQRRCIVQLSCKVIDREERLRSTLLHELCHVGQFLLENEEKPPHGAGFRKWARIATRLFPETPVSVTHNYYVTAPFQYSCENCGSRFGRHSKLRETEIYRCSRCGGGLRFLGRLGMLGELQSPKTASRTLTPYNRFVEANFRTVKAQNPGASYGKVMELVGQQWRVHKQSSILPGSPRSTPTLIPRSE